MFFFSAIKKFFKIFTVLVFKDGFFRILLITSLALNLFLWAILYLKFSEFRSIGEVLPLHYNIYFGVDFIGRWYEIFIMPLVGIFFIIINLILADIIYLRDKVTSYFLAGVSAFIQVLLSLAAYAVIMINQ
ncbi:hypothetical protein HZB93_00220 [Candidatus Falkowbacteria bacterium]|nr:hypothetical protein [Candidatus Falkowbacteria bacterium]